MPMKGNFTNSSYRHGTRSTGSRHIKTGNKDTTVLQFLFGCWFNSIFFYFQVPILHVCCTDTYNEEFHIGPGEIIYTGVCLYFAPQSLAAAPEATTDGNKAPTAPDKPSSVRKLPLSTYRIQQPRLLYYLYRKLLTSPLQFTFACVDKGVCIHHY